MPSAPLEHTSQVETLVRVRVRAAQVIGKLRIILFSCNSVDRWLLLR